MDEKSPYSEYGYRTCRIYRNMDALLFDRFYIPIEGTDPQLLGHLRDALTINNPEYEPALKYSPWGTTKVPKYLKFYDDSSPRYLGIPRGFKTDFLSQEHQEYLQSLHVRDKRFKQKKIMPTFSEEHLHPDQQSVVEEVVSSMRDKARNGASLVVLPVSSGKTRIGLACACRLRQRTLILCDTQLIAESWRTEIDKLFGWSTKKRQTRRASKLKYKNKIMPNVGLIKQQHVDVGRYFTIVSWQTVNRRGVEFWDWLSRAHPFMIIDEAESCPSKTFIHFVMGFSGQHMLAITGTDYRADGLEEVMFMQFGKPLIKRTSKNIETVSSIPVKEVKTIVTQFRYSWNTGDFDHNKYDQECGEDINRVQLISDHVIKEYSDGHYCLVAANSKSHAKSLYRHIASMEGVNASDVCFLFGGVEEAIAKRALKGHYSIVVATTRYIFKGANCPRLDRLFMASLIKDERTLNQLFGRIRRKAEGKKDAVVYEFNDPVKAGSVKRSHIERWNVYAAMGIDKFKNMIHI